MKKLLTILSCVLLFACCDKPEPDTLSYEAQWHENAKLVGTWRTVEKDSFDTNDNYVFTTEFKLSVYYTRDGMRVRGGYDNNPYSIPRAGELSFSEATKNWRYRFENASLFITDMVASGKERECRKVDE